MSTPPGSVFSLRTFESWANDHQSLLFVISRLIGQVITIVPVRVNGVTNSGSLTSCPYVNVQPLLNQMTGNQTAVPHGVVYNVPCFRLQRGGSAMVLDPVAGDIGLVLVGYRDTSNIIAADKASPGSLQGGSRSFNPGSQAQYDWASGFYLGGWLNGPLTQYIEMTSSGITMVAPGGINLNGVTIDSSGNLTSPATIQGLNLDGTTDVYAGSGLTAVSLYHHIHSGVTTGSGDSGAPVPGT